MDARRADPALSAADSAWWRMEEPDNQMVITAVLTFDGPLDLRAPRGAAGAPASSASAASGSASRSRRSAGRPAALGGRRATSRSTATCSAPPSPARGPGGAPGAGERADERAARPPRARSGSFHYVERYRGGSALVGRLHHCIADGIALIHVLLTLDDVPGNESGAARLGGAPPPGRRRRRPRGGRRCAPWPRWRRARRRRVRPALARLVGMPFDPRTAAARPPRRAQARRLVGAGAAGGACGAAGAPRSAARCTTCWPPPSRARCASYLPERGAPVTPRRARGGPGEPAQRRRGRARSGNRFGLVFLPLPVGIADPVAAPARGEAGDGPAEALPRGAGALRPAHSSSGAPPRGWSALSSTSWG